MFKIIKMCENYFFSDMSLFYDGYINNLPITVDNSNWLPLLQKWCV